jgi:hypothetical protein
MKPMGKAYGVLNKNGDRDQFSTRGKLLSVPVFLSPFLIKHHSRLLSQLETRREGYVRIRDVR